jgi:ribosomal protein S6--L-glutamate ligase
VSEHVRIGVIGVPGGWSSEALADAVAARTGERILIDMEHVVFESDSRRVRFGDLDLCGLDALIVKKIGISYSPDLLDRLEILRFVESRGVEVFSAPERMIRLVDRLSGTVTLAATGVPMPATTVTEDLGEAVAAVRRYQRAVLKPLYSTKARGMTLISSGEDVETIVARFRDDGNAVMYVQEKLELPGRDLGIAFLGGRYVGAYARVASSTAWNTTIRAGGRYEAVEPAGELIDLAHAAQAPFDLAFTCVDVVETDRGPLVFEVSAFGGFRGLKEGAGIDAAELYAGHVVERIAGA